MKILHITPQFEPDLGGIGRHATHLVRGLTARGHEQVVVAAHGILALPDEAVVEEVRIHRVPFYRGIDGRDAGALLRAKLRTASIKRAFAPDVVHLHIGGPMAFLHLSTTADTPAPLVVTVHDLPPNISDSPTLVGMFESAARIAAVSNVRLADLHRDLPSVATRSRRIYPGSPAPPASDPATRDLPPLLLAGGRLVPEKGFATAIDAMAVIHDRRPDARLVITGDGIARSALEAQCHRLGLDLAVTFTGTLSSDALDEWRRRAWVTLVPTLRGESFGLVALEAMQAGSPVVASSIEGLREVVADGETGCLVPPGDTMAMAEAALAIVSDRETMTRVGRAGQQRAANVFGLDGFLDAYEQLFVDALT